VIVAKICGITRPEDARLAAELGASAIGMVFWNGSPRAVDVTQACEIVSAIPPFVTAVGVFVDQPVGAVQDLAAETGLDVIQLHGHEAPADYAGTGRRLIKSVAIQNGSTESDVAAACTGATALLDAHDPVKRGGTGRSIDWTIAAAIARRRPIILSGGLNADNVLTAIRTVAPYAVDASSGVESSPGRKDPAKLRQFFDALRTV
jgi:phosphoribosylanthranilate isomerase